MVGQYSLRTSSSSDSLLVIAVSSIGTRARAAIDDVARERLACTVRVSADWTLVLVRGLVAVEESLVSLQAVTLGQMQ